MNRTVGPPLRTDASSSPGDDIDHRVGRYVDELNRVSPPMTVDSYLDMERKGNSRV